MPQGLIPAYAAVVTSKTDIKNVLQQASATDSRSTSTLADSPWTKHAPPGFDKPIKKFAQQDTCLDITVLDQNNLSSLVKDQQPHIHSLTFLCGPVTVLTIQKLMQLSWPALRTLNFCGAQLDYGHMKHLTECTCPNLINLDLSMNKIGEEAMFRFSSVGEKWPNLENLTLSSSQLEPGMTSMQLTHVAIMALMCIRSSVETHVLCVMLQDQWCTSSSPSSQSFRAWTSGTTASTA